MVLRRAQHHTCAQYTLSLRQEVSNIKVQGRMHAKAQAGHRSHAVFVKCEAAESITLHKAPRSLRCSKQKESSVIVYNCRRWHNGTACNQLQSNQEAIPDFIP